MLTPGTQMIVDGHPSYPALCDDENSFTAYPQPKFAKGMLSTNAIERVWGDLKARTKEIYAHDILQPETILQVLAEAEFRNKYLND